MIKVTAISATLTLTLFFPAVAHADPDVPPVVPVVANTITPPLADVLSANPTITNPDLIFPGQVVIVPGREPHTVLAGDTLTLILAAPGGGNDPIAPPQALPAPAATTPVQPAVAHSGINWDAVAKCESGGNWAINTGNSYEGGVQFLNSTWRSVKGPDDPPHAYQASREQQIAAAERLLARSGIGQWPVCGRRG